MSLHVRNWGLWGILADICLPVLAHSSHSEKARRFGKKKIPQILFLCSAGWLVWSQNVNWTMCIVTDHWQDRVVIGGGFSLWRNGENVLPLDNTFFTCGWEMAAAYSNSKCLWTSHGRSEEAGLCEHPPTTGLLHKATPDPHHKFKPTWSCQPHQLLPELLPRKWTEVEACTLLWINMALNLCQKRFLSKSLSFIV